MAMKQSLRGFSLIELMVGLSIMAMALAAMSSLGASWVNESRVTDARSQMRLAYSKARALATQNSNATTATTAVAAWVCTASGVAYVYTTAPGSCGVTGFLWKADLAGGSSTTVETAAAANSTAFACMGLSNRGLPVVGASLGANTCTTDQTVYIKKGNVNEATTLN